MGSAPGVLRKPRKDRVFEFVSVYLTCQDLGIDGKLFIYAMFKIHNFQRSPGYKVLNSPWAYKRFLRDESKFLAEWGHENMPVAQPVDPNLDTTPFGEGLKQALEPDQCITAIGEHGGYHPLSDHCRGCSLARQCSDQVRNLMGVDMGLMRAKPREEAISVLKNLFKNYPRTPLTGGAHVA